MSRSSRAKKPEEAQTEASLIPIMSCMFLLIPALLLAMEVARHAAIEVSTPAFTTRPTSEPAEPVERVSVRIRGEGFSTGRAEVNPAVDIPSTGPDYDFDALESFAANLSATEPGQFTVHLSAEGDVPLDTVVNAMDALRGPDCSLRGALAGERVSDGCHLWNVVIES